MESIVPIHYVNSFRANVFHLSQQKSSRLRGLVRTETQKAEKDFYDYYDLATEPTERVSKYADVKFEETPRGRRACFLKHYEKTEPFSAIDKLMMIHDPQSNVSQAFQSSYGRKFDKVILQAALGTSYSGKEGTTPVVLPTTQKVVAFDGTTTTGVKMNIKTLKAIKKKFSKNEVEGEIILVCSTDEIDSLLDEDKVASADYNTIRALVAGSVDSFMGIVFKKTELVRSSNPQVGNVTYTVTDGTYGAGTGTLTASVTNRCVAFVKQGIVLAIAEDMVAKVSERNDKGDVMQLFTKMSIGGTRLEEKCVVEVCCKGDA